MALQENPKFEVSGYEDKKNPESRKMGCSEKTGPRHLKQLAIETI